MRLDTWTKAGVSNSKGLAGRMNIKILNYIFKINVFGKINKLAQCFLKNLHFYQCSRAAIDPLAGRVFETPGLEQSFSTGRFRPTFGSPKPVAMVWMGCQIDYNSVFEPEATKC